MDAGIKGKDGWDAVLVEVVDGCFSHTLSLNSLHLIIRLCKSTVKRLTNAGEFIILCGMGRVKIENYLTADEIVTLAQNAEFSTADKAVITFGSHSLPLSAYDTGVRLLNTAAECVQDWIDENVTGFITPAKCMSDGAYVDKIWEGFKTFFGMLVRNEISRAGGAYFGMRWITDDDIERMRASDWRYYGSDGYALCKVAYNDEVIATIPTETAQYVRGCISALDELQGA